MFDLDPHSLIETVLLFTMEECELISASLDRNVYIYIYLFCCICVGEKGCCGFLI